MTKDDVTIRVGSQDTLTFQLLSSQTAIDLTGVNYIDLFLKSSIANTTLSFRSNTTTSILTISAASTGTLQFIPTSTTFSSETVYFFYFVINDATGKDIPVPEHTEYRWKVRFKYGS